MQILKAQSLTCVNAVVLRALQTSSRLPHALVIAPDSRVLDGVKRFSPPPAVTWYFSSQSGHVLCLPTCFPALESWFLLLVVSKGVRRRELATTAVRGPDCTGQGPTPAPEEVRTGPQREGPGHRPPGCWVLAGPPLEAQPACNLSIFKQLYWSVIYFQFILILFSPQYLTIKNFQHTGKLEDFGVRTCVHPLPGFQWTVYYSKLALSH